MRRAANSSHRAARSQHRSPLLGIEGRLLRRKVFDQSSMSNCLFAFGRSRNSGCLAAASLMESGAYVNAGKLECLSSYKSLN